MDGWFPRTVGHAGAKLALRNAIEGGRLPGSSLLLCGPRGVGRALLAQELAQAANCRREGAGPRPCGSCRSCRKIAQALSGDTIVLQPTDKPSIGIDACRDMLDELALAPVENPLRVFIVDPASALHVVAQNALLKALEEPPARSLIVLIAEHEGELLSTIVSRCRVVRLGELTLAEVEAVLRAQGVEPGEARERARWSGGSPGEALDPSLLETIALVEQTLEALATGSAYRDPMATAERLLDFAGKGGGAAAKRTKISQALRHLARALRDALLRREGARAEGAPDAVLLERLALLPRGKLEASLDAVVEVEEELNRNANTKLVIDGLVLDVGAALAPSR